MDSYRERYPSVWEYLDWKLEHKFPTRKGFTGMRHARIEVMIKDMIKEGTIKENEQKAIRANF